MSYVIATKIGGNKFKQGNEIYYKIIKHWRKQL